LTTRAQAMQSTSVGRRKARVRRMLRAEAYTYRRGDTCRVVSGDTVSGSSTRATLRVSSWSVK